jgi:hypothetical protein
MRIDLNFHSEDHPDIFAGLGDLELPAGWTLEQLAMALHNAKFMLWSELIVVDEETGTVSWR